MSMSDLVEALKKKSEFTELMEKVSNDVRTLDNMSRAWQFSDDLPLTLSRILDDVAIISAHLNSIKTGAITLRSRPYKA